MSTTIGIHTEKSLTAKPPIATGNGVERKQAVLSIVSNSQLLREGLTSVLSNYLDILLIGSYSTTTDLTQALPNPAGHIILLDNGIGYADSVNWTRYWRSLQPSGAVLVLELTNDLEVIIACIEMGAAGYTIQGATVAEVAEAIRHVQEGRAYCSSQVTAELFARVANAKARSEPSQPKNIPLTAREIEVVRFIAQGCSNRDIAATLVIELSTVKHHVHTILEKLEVDHRWEAARLAIERGWISSPQPNPYHR